MKKCCLLLCLLLLCPLTAQAQSISLSPGEYSVDYSFYSAEGFALLTYETNRESGTMVIQGQAGQFSGQVALPLSGGGGRVKLTAHTLKKALIAQGETTLPQAADYEVLSGVATATVNALNLTESGDRIGYAFYAPGAQYLLLNYRSRQQSGTLPVYPVDEQGRFSGELSLPLTYARGMVTVSVLSISGKTLAEGQIRKGYAPPEAPAQQPGRLTGVTVCIDPGHQENGRLVTEPLGPGLSGSTAGTAGMAQGVETLRKESIVALEIGMALRNELLRQGASVVMTRETQDVFHTNQERCQIAAEGGADIMLRLHCDLREGDAAKRGISVYGPLNAAYAKAVAKPSAYRHMGQLLLDAMKSSVGYALEERTGRVTLNDQFVGNNWAKMPCFLVEMGFMSNPQEDLLLSTPAYQQLLAEGMAQGVYDIALYRGWVGQ